MIKKINDDDKKAKSIKMCVEIVYSKYEKSIYECILNVINTKMR